MKKITLIGLGWLGLPLAEHLQQQGWQVIGTKRGAYSGEIKSLVFDLADFHDEILTELLDCEALFINIPPSNCSPATYSEGIKRLVSAAVLQNVAHILFISSTSVLPMQSGNFDETCEISSENWLGNLEKWLLAQPTQIDVLRLAGLVGKQRHPVFHLTGKSNLSGAQQPVNLVHLDDCLTAISLLLSKPNGQRLFHLCAPQHPTKQAYYSKIAERFSLAPLHFYEENQPLVRQINGEKICRELGFHYQHPDPYRFPLEIEIKKS